MKSRNGKVRLRYDRKKTHTLRCCRPKWVVCTSDPAINVARITQRYMNGGHEVPISKIITRYYKSLANVAKAITFIDRAYIYDNSVDNQLPKLLYRTTDGKPCKRYTDDIPLWAQTIID